MLGGVDSVDTGSILAELGNEREPAPAQSQAETAPAADENKPWEAPDWARFEWNSKNIVPDSPEKAKTWISQGYNYAQRMGELNKTQREWQARQAEWEPKIQRWQEVDTYARQNPQWWQHVEQSWQNRGQAQGAQTAQGAPQDISAYLAPINEKIQKYEDYFQKQEMTAAEKALDEQVDQIRQKHPNIDLNAVDATGRTLEARIYAHANQNGIPTFRAAYYDLLSDKLLEQSSANAREAAAKQQVGQVRSGIIGQSPTPQRAMQSANLRPVKTQSWDQVAQNALAELGY